MAIQVARHGCPVTHLLMQCALLAELAHADLDPVFVHIQAGTAAQNDFHIPSSGTCAGDIGNRFSLPCVLAISNSFGFAAMS
jgi:hypothetical protein